MTTPALVQNPRLDLLATNQLGRAIYPHIDGTSRAPFNFARFVFLDPRAREFYRDRELAAQNNAAPLRAAAAKDPHDEGLIQLVGQLSTQSASSAPCGPRTTYSSTARAPSDPLVGDLTFGSQQFQLSTEPGLVMLVYTAEAGSPTYDALQLLASKTTPCPQTRAAQTDG